MSRSLARGTPTATLAWLLLAGASCGFDPQPISGKLLCGGAMSTACPPGYRCAVDGRCWRNGEEPGDGSAGDAGTLDALEVGLSLEDQRADDAPDGAASRSEAGADVDGMSFDPSTVKDGPSGDGEDPRDVALTPADVAADVPADVPAVQWDTGGHDTATEAPSCQDACQLGATKCGRTGGLETCVSAQRGCAVWGIEQPCSGSQVCLGDAPKGACACRARPAGCEAGAGSFCKDGTTVQACVADADGCITLSVPMGCPPGKPCTGTHPSANCSCAEPPVACAGGAGTVCQGNLLVTCGLDANGCLSITSMTACPTGKPCGGTAPGAACTCPPPPPDCGTAGSVCRANNSLATCGTNADGCLAISSAVTCPTGRSCVGLHPTASCACPAPPTGCLGLSSGTFCASANTLTSCVLDASGCVAGNTMPCTSGCLGTHPSAACCVPACSGKCGGSDGCGGACPNNCVQPQTCGGGGAVNVCGCTASCTGKCSGPDGCGGTCTGSCSPPQTCGGGSTMNVCGCTPACAGKCGGPDGCGSSCPDDCVGPKSCGGGGTPNVCGRPAHLVVTPAVQDWGDVVIGRFGQHGFTITNDGDATWTGLLGIPGATWPFSAWANHCDTTSALNPGQSCNMYLRLYCFESDGVGTRIGTFIVDATPGGPLVASMIGRCVAQ